MKHKIGRRQLAKLTLAAMLPHSTPQFTSADLSPSLRNAPTLARWQSSVGGFGAWQGEGKEIAADGAVRLDPGSALLERDPYRTSGYLSGTFYTGGDYLVGTATGPAVALSYTSPAEVIPSWTAATPAGTWLELLVRARIAGNWSNWYNLGVWASDTSTIQRHSVRNQRDSNGRVSTDTLLLNRPADAVQIKVRLFQAPDQTAAVPAISSISVVCSPTGQDLWSEPSEPGLVAHALHLPQCSQMIYPNGGEVWCSPTSISMVLGYWLPTSDSCEPRVQDAVAGVYDWVYGGHGNWAFNTAYAATHGLDAYVARFTNLAETEPLIAAGIPLILSYGWNRGELSGAPLPSSNGHLVVLAGFDTAGNPIIYDPAAPTNGTVRRTYPRAQIERLWLTRSAGTAYVIHPPAPPLI